MGLPREGLQFFAALIESEIGIVYTDVNHYQLEARLDEIALQLGHGSAVELWERSRTSGLEDQAKMLLLDVATNNETLFFRDVRTFRAVARVITEFHKPNHVPIRIWSAACSTGQEVYSLAMVREELSTANPPPLEIYATDVSERVLRRAEAGVYSQLEVQRGIAASRPVAFFEQVTTSAGAPPAWRVNSKLRKGITFRQLNLLSPWPNWGRFDIILCRNVLIYLTLENKRKVVAKLTACLEPGGYLILGGAESLVGICDELVWTDIEGAVLYRKPENSPPKR